MHPLTKGGGAMWGPLESETAARWIAGAEASGH